MMIVICYPKCSTCKKALQWLDKHELPYTYRHIKEENPTESELKDWHKKSGLPLKRFFNTSGQLYREHNVKDRLPNMSEEEQYALLSSDGMLVKRPILLDDGVVLVGFKEAEWEAALLKGEKA